MKDLNIINKLLTIILLGILLYFSYDDIIFYLICCIGIVALINVKKRLWVILFILPIVMIIIEFESNLVSVHNLCALLMIFGFVVVFVSSLTVDERRYVFDKTFYKWKDYKKTRKHLYKCYYDKCFNNNINEVPKYNRLSNYKSLTKQANIKSMNDLDEIYVLNRLRFYQLYSKKRVSFPDKWKKYDTFYLITMVVVCILLLVK